MTLSRYAKDYYARTRRYGQAVADIEPGSVPHDGPPDPGSSRPGPVRGSTGTVLAPAQTPRAVCPFCERIFTGYAATCRDCE